MAFPANIRIVLVEPETSGNVGSAARALWTLGLSELVVVAPRCDPRDVEAYRLAHAAGCVLDSLQIVPTLETALAGTVFSVATTRRRRRVAYPVFLPAEAVSQLKQRCPDQPAAIVFGRESSGLTNPELALCSIHSSIPCAQEDHSLNLAQAVLVYCHELHQASLAPHEAQFEWRLVEHSEMEHFYARLERLLERLGAHPATTMENYLARFRRVFSRMALETRDVRLLHKLLTRIEAAQASPCPPPSADG
ncbi:MAG: RNA methyltransferase [Planctomycetaceae bacterium]|nr:MAG: RNA methyltransferase [Planctomycetaceae bacterium]